MEYFEAKDCANFEEFIAEVQPKINDGWIFRGHTKGEWHLEHTFERACDRFNIPSKDRLRIENNMIREFKRRLHHYSSHIPSSVATGEWLALMRHHGAVTRLLDFTYSPYIAAFFAFESAEPNTTIAIWAVQAGWFTNILQKASPRLYIKYEEYRSKREEKEELFDKVFRTKTQKRLILATNPFRLNERQAYQRSVFLCPGDVSISFKQNFSAYGEHEVVKHVIKYTIQTGIKNENTIEALEQLDIMNISRITLFPGLDGFAQSFENRIDSLFKRQSYDDGKGWLSRVE